MLRVFARVVAMGWARSGARAEIFARTMAIATAMLVLGGVIAMARAAQRVALDYQAPDGCPSSEELMGFVRRRTPLAEFVTSEEATMRFRVDIRSERIAQRTVRWVGRFAQAVGRAGRNAGGLREVVGDSCIEVVDALALMTALAIDPSASTKPLELTPTARPTSAPTVTPPPPTPPPTSAPIAPPPPKPREPTPPRRPPRPRTELDYWQFGGATHFVARGLAPGPVWGGSIDFEASRRAAERVPGPILRAGFSRSLPKIIGDPFVARFVWNTGTLEGCPVGYAPVRFFAIWPCVGVEAGAIAARDPSGVDPVAVTRAWAAWWLSGRLQLRPTPNLTIEANGGMFQPFTRDRFLLEPSTTIFRVPVITWMGSIGLAVAAP